MPTFNGGDVVSAQPFEEGDQIRKASFLVPSWAY